MVCRPETMIAAIEEYGTIGHYEVFAPETRDYQCHHSKFIIAQHPRGLRLIVTTANFNRCEGNTKTQGLWWQDFPKKVSMAPSDQVLNCSMSS